MTPNDNFSDRIAAYNEELRRYYRRGHGDAPTQASDADRENFIATSSPLTSASNLSSPAPPTETVAPLQSEAEPPAPPFGTYTSKPPQERPWETSSGFEEAISPVSPPDVRPTSEPVQAAFPTDTSVPPFGNGNATEAAQTTSDAPNDADTAEEDVGYLRVRAYSAKGAVPLSGVTVTIGRLQNETPEILYVTTTDESGFTPVFSLPTVSRNASLTPSPVPVNSIYTVLAELPRYYSSFNERVDIYGGVLSVQDVPMIPLPDPVGRSDTIIKEGANTPELN